jgi:hypothetical protein
MKIPLTFSVRIWYNNLQLFAKNKRCKENLMKKLISVLLCLMMSIGLLSACGSAGTNEPTATSANAGTSAAQQTAETTDPLEQLQVHTETYTESDRVKVEYLSLTGLPEEAKQIYLNEQIKEFFLWQWVMKGPDAEPDDATYTGKATYELKGSLLTVTRTLVAVLESGTDPVQCVDSRTFDLLNPGDEEATSDKAATSSEAAKG